LRILLLLLLWLLGLAIMGAAWFAFFSWAGSYI
jgi:hypothetical protein